MAEGRGKRAACHRANWSKLGFEAKLGSAVGFMPYSTAATPKYSALCSFPEGQDRFKSS